MVEFYHMPQLSTAQRASSPYAMPLDFDHVTSQVMSKARVDEPSRALFWRHDNYDRPPFTEDLLDCSTDSASQEAIIANQREFITVRLASGSFLRSGAISRSFPVLSNQPMSRSCSKKDSHVFAPSRTLRTGRDFPWDRFTAPNKAKWHQKFTARLE